MPTTWSGRHWHGGHCALCIIRSSHWHAAMVSMEVKKFSACSKTFSNGCWGVASHILEALWRHVSWLLNHMGSPCVVILLQCCKRVPLVRSTKLWASQQVVGYVSASGSAYPHLHNIYIQAYIHAYICKLRQLDVGGHFLSILTEFLSNRLQRVVVDGQFNDYRNVISGVPQGSVLGPWLFILYTHDV